MKYKVYLTIKGYIEIEAESEEEAENIVDNGYAMDDFIFESDDIDGVEKD